MGDGGHEGVRASLARENGYRFRVSFGEAGTPAIVTDEPAPLGAGSGPNPSELLAAAVGNCLASSLLFCMQKARLDASGLSGEVLTRTVRNPSGRLRIAGIRVRLAPTVSSDVRQKMDRCLELFESFCIVTESVRQGIPVSVTVEPRIAPEETVQAAPSGGEPVAVGDR